MISTKMKTTMHTMLIDGANMLYRARSGFQAGDHAVTFNFFRSLRALVEQFRPNRIIFVQEGSPKARLAVFPEYKGNRKREHDEKYEAQKKEIFELLSSNIPVSIVRHPDHECDDVIFNLINVSSRAVKFTVISTDSDFTQLLNKFENVSIYNPVKKKMVEWDTNYDYVTYKSLKGDVSDNIPGFLGIGEKKAMSLALSMNKEILQEFISRSENTVQWSKNTSLIGFETWTNPELMTSTSPTRNWDHVKEKFNKWEFASITNEKSWNKFVATFDNLFSS